MNSFIKISAPAKINLCLDILERDPSDYHKIQTVFQEIPEISDEIEIITTDKSDKLSIKYSPSLTTDLRLSKSLKSPKVSPPRPPSEGGITFSPLSVQPNENHLCTQNLAYQALLLLKKTYKITNKFAHLNITKNIPISSGLGGASSDAAAVLKGLNRLWNLKISQKELLKLAAELGKDVPFFIIGGTALGENYGEKITPLKPIIGDGGPRVIFQISPKSSSDPEKTKNAYAKLDLTKCAKNLSKTEKLLKAIEQENYPELIANLHNDFEQLYSLEKNHHLTGSGPSRFRCSLGYSTAMFHKGPLS